jgi:hypothetical protein
LANGYRDAIAGKYLAKARLSNYHELFCIVHIGDNPDSFKWYFSPQRLWQAFVHVEKFANNVFGRP